MSGSSPAKSAALLVLCLTGALAAAGCGNENQKAKNNSAQTPTIAAKNRVLYWKSPMMKGFRSDKPGKDPMGSDLVPVYAVETPAGPPGSVTIAPQTIQQIGVKTVVIRRRKLDRDVRTVGRIDYDEALVRDVAPKIGGWLEKQYVNFPGQFVLKGEPLGEIYSPELVATQEEYLNALKYQGTLKGSPLEDAAAGARSLVRAVETRLRYWNITGAQIQALRDRGRITRTMVLYAPFTGVVVKKNVFEGGYVNPGESMYRIADLSRIWVYADIYEYETPWLSLGQEATMKLSYAPGVTYRGRVVYVYPYLKRKTRTLEVRMEFRNGGTFDLKPGMWANVDIKSPVVKKALVIPVAAVLRTGKRDLAILALGGGYFVPREIKLGAQAGNYFEVLRGLKKGERVVDSAEFLINSESSLESALNKMTWGPANAPNAPDPATEGTAKPVTRPHEDSGRE